MPGHENEHGEGSTVEVTVFAPNSTEGKPFSFKKNMSVAEAAALAAQALGYAAKDPTFAKAEQILDRLKNLAADGLKDGDVLELVDAGGGVCS